jgi:hypothetical protein
MEERSQVAVASLVGAVAGGVLGYLYLTPEGRRIREELGPWLDNLSREIDRLREVAERARVAAAQGRQSFEELRERRAAETRPASGFPRSAS